MTNITISENCIKCCKCVEICPSVIFSKNSINNSIEVNNPENCIGCSHCIGVCPQSAIIHSKFPANKIVSINFDKYPSPEQMMEIIRGRRSNRSFSKTPINQKNLDLILEAARYAPTATNSRKVGWKLITKPEEIKTISEFTISVFAKIAKIIDNPLIRPILKPFMKTAYRYLPTFYRLVDEFNKGNDLVLRGATAVILFYTPKSSMFGMQDANLSYQNASLMAESLGISQFYTGFVYSAIKQDKQKTLNKLLSIEGNIYAGMALGIPKYKITKTDNKQ